MLFLFDIKNENNYKIFNISSLLRIVLLTSEGISGQLAATVNLCRISDSHRFTGQLAKAVHLWAAMYLFIGCSSITIIDSIVRAAYGTTLSFH